MRRKLGLVTEEEGDGALAQDLLNAMADGEADFTLTFRAARSGDWTTGGAGRCSADPAAFDAWAVRWRERLAREPQDAATRRAMMRSANPVATFRATIVSRRRSPPPSSARTSRRSRNC